MAPPAAASAGGEVRCGHVVLVALGVVTAVAAVVVMEMAGIPAVITAGGCVVALAAALLTEGKGSLDCGCQTPGPELAEQLLLLQSAGAGTSTGGSPAALPCITIKGGLADADALVLAGAIRECGPRVELAGLSVTQCPLLGTAALAELLSAALSPGLSLSFLDLSSNPQLGGSAVGALSDGLRSSGGQALRALHLADCALTPADLNVLFLGTSPADLPSGALPEPVEDTAMPPPPKLLPPSGTAPCRRTLGLQLPELAEDTAMPPPPKLLLPSGTAPSRRTLGLQLLEPAEDTAMPPPPKLLPPSGTAPSRRTLGLELRVLDLSGNQLGGAGRALVRLVRLPGLEQLILERCSLLPDDCTWLASALPRSDLIRLDLGYNGLASAELLKLAGALPRSKVEDLGLEGNKFEAGDALESLREAWTRRPILRLRLNNNNLSSRELQIFMQSLRSRRAGSVLFGTATLCLPGCKCEASRGSGKLE